jgi:predicted O-methyltransferase YrrM
MNEKFKQVQRFLKYFLLARHTNGHGIHSPFMFAFVTKVIFSKNDTNRYSRVAKYYTFLKKCKNLVEITDIGAGSRFGNKTKRKISAIASNSSTHRKYGKLLARIVDNQKPTNIIELGTSLGIGSFYLSLNMLPESKLYTIEGSEALLSFSKEHCDAFRLPNVFPICGEFDKVLPELLSSIECVDLVYIDGNHRKDATIKYFEWLLPRINTNSILIFDDIHWSTGMQEAWEYIRLHLSVKVTIDLFQFGIVLFKKELSKQDYVIRF